MVANRQFKAGFASDLNRFGVGGSHSPFAVELLGEAPSSKQLLTVLHSASRAFLRADDLRPDQHEQTQKGPTQGFV